jgi:hypothetical protein
MYKNTTNNSIEQHKKTLFSLPELVFGKKAYPQLASAKLAICRKKSFFGQSKFSFLRGLRLILY